MTTAEDRKRMSEAKRKFDLHVLLLMERDGLTKTQAQVEAYVAGMNGLTLLMANTGLKSTPQK